MRLRTTQSGFAAMEMVILVAVVGVVGCLGFALYNGYQYKMAHSTDSAATVASEVPATPAITTADDLDGATAVMDKMDIEASNTDDLSTLDSDLANF
jgi:Flp pilus assembly protein TadG